MRLQLPIRYVEIENDEIEYIDGGASISGMIAQGKNDNYVFA